MATGQSARLKPSSSREPGGPIHQVVVEENVFHQGISWERKRTERSGRPFALMLLEGESDAPADTSASLLKRVARVIVDVTRETDSIGWYRSPYILGVIFTDVGSDDWEMICTAIHKRISAVLENGIPAECLRSLTVSFHVFPEDQGNDDGQWTRNPLLYPDHAEQRKYKSTARLLKRTVDIAGAAIGLVLCSPLMVIIAVLVKLTSYGPVFYRQERVGEDGVRFIFLKFRSMYVDNDPRKHREYVQQMIAGKAEPHAQKGTTVYKLTTDPRVTRIGALLRKISFDELPQLVNVLRGEMSLVGPRPPIAYEVEVYQTWHRRRILEAKPGITGLWQVNGRSRIKFDEMVRLDLAYAKRWSLWLDLKILLRTPRAVLEGSH